MRASESTHLILRLHRSVQSTDEKGEGSSGRRARVLILAELDQRECTRELGRGERSCRSLQNRDKVVSRESSTEQKEIKRVRARSALS